MPGRERLLVQLQGPGMPQDDVYKMNTVYHTAVEHGARAERKEMGGGMWAALSAATPTTRKHLMRLAQTHKSSPYVKWQKELTAHDELFARRREKKIKNMDKWMSSCAGAATGLDDATSCTRVVNGSEVTSEYANDSSGLTRKQWAADCMLRGGDLDPEPVCTTQHKGGQLESYPDEVAEELLPGLVHRAGGWYHPREHRDAP